MASAAASIRRRSSSRLLLIWTERAASRSGPNVRIRREDQGPLVTHVRRGTSPEGSRSRADLVKISGRVDNELLWRLLFRLAEGHRSAEPLAPRRPANRQGPCSRATVRRFLFGWLQHSRSAGSLRTLNSVDFRLGSEAEVAATQDPDGRSLEGVSSFWNQAKVRSWRQADERRADCKISLPALTIQRSGGWGAGS